MTHRRVALPHNPRFTSKLQNAKFIPRPYARRDNPWPFAVTFMIVFSFRFLSAIFSPVMDCDEIYNYVEPLHLILYGRGLQTWEYAPQYGLRSWLLLWIYAAVARIVGFLGLEAMYAKVGVLVGLRIALAAFSAFCQSIFIRSVGRRFGLKTSLVLLFFLIFSPGMTHAGHAILPQSFAMNVLLLALSSWINAITCKHKHSAGVYDSINFHLAEDRLAEVRGRANSHEQSHGYRAEQPEAPPVRERGGRRRRERVEPVEEASDLLSNSSSSDSISSEAATHPATQSGSTVRHRRIHSLHAPFSPSSRSGQSPPQAHGDQDHTHTNTHTSSYTHTHTHPHASTSAPALVSASASSSLSAPMRVVDSGAACESSSFIAHAWVVWWCCIAGLLGWPFVLVFVIPLGADMVDCYVHVHVVVVAAMGFIRRIILARLVSPAELVYHAHAHAHAHAQTQTHTQVQPQPHGHAHGQAQGHGQVSEAELSSPSSDSIDAAHLPPSPPPPPTRMSVGTIMHTVLLQWPLHVSTAPLKKRMLKLAQLAGIGAVSAFVVLLASVLVDSSHYGTWTVSVWNIVKYNSNYSGDEGDASQGQQLYGTEPLSYYFVNLFLNFNVVWVLCLLQLLVGVFAWVYVRVLVPTGVIELIALKIGHSKYMYEVSRGRTRTMSHESAGSDLSEGMDAGSGGGSGSGAYVLMADNSEERRNSCSPSFSSVMLSSLSSSILTKSRLLKTSMYLCRISSQFHILTPLLFWCLVMFPQPHKEERFLYVAYPLICLGGAFGLELLIDVCVTCRDIIAATFTLPLPLLVIARGTRSIIQAMGSYYRQYTPQLLQMAVAQILDAFVTIFYNPSTESIKDPHDPDLYLDDFVNSNTTSLPSLLSSSSTFMPGSPFVASHQQHINTHTHAPNNARPHASNAAPTRARAHSAAIAPSSLPLSEAPFSQFPAGPIPSPSPLPSLFRINIIKRAYSPWRGLSFAIVAVVYLLFTTLSVARSIALINGYSAPGAAFFALFAQLHADMAHREVIRFDQPVMLTLPSTFTSANTHTNSHPHTNTQKQPFPSAPILPNIISPLHTPYPATPLLDPTPSLPKSFQRARPSLLSIAAAISHARLVGARVDERYVQKAQNNTLRYYEKSHKSALANENNQDTSSTILLTTPTASSAAASTASATSAVNVRSPAQQEALCLARVMLGHGTLKQCTMNMNTSINITATNTTSTASLGIPSSSQQRVRPSRPSRLPYNAQRLRGARPLNWALHAPMLAHDGFYALPLLTSTSPSKSQRARVDEKEVLTAVQRGGFMDEMDFTSDCACDDVKKMVDLEEDRCVLDCGTSLRMIDSVLDTLYSGYGRHVHISQNITLVFDTELPDSVEQALKLYISTTTSSYSTSTSTPSSHMSTNDIALSSLPPVVLPHLLAILSPQRALLSARILTPPHKHNRASTRNPYRILNVLPAYIPASPLSHTQLRAVVEETTVARVCVGHDWYRFPSSFFLPEAQWVDAPLYATTLYRAFNTPHTATTSTTSTPTPASATVIAAPTTTAAPVPPASTTSSPSSPLAPSRETEAVHVHDVEAEHEEERMSPLLQLLQPFVVVGNSLAQLVPKHSDYSSMLPHDAGHGHKLPHGSSKAQDDGVMSRDEVTMSPFAALSTLGTSASSTSTSTSSPPHLSFDALAPYRVLARPRLVIDFLESGFGGVLPQHFAEAHIPLAASTSTSTSASTGSTATSTSSSTTSSISTSSAYLPASLPNNNDFAAPALALPVPRRLPWGPLPPAGARVRAPHFNDLNQRDAARLVPSVACDWIVEADLRVRTEAFKRIVYDTQEYPPAYPGMRVGAQLTMLDPDRSSGLHRAFFIHPLWTRRNKFMPVTTWERAREQE